MVNAESTLQLWFGGGSESFSNEADFIYCSRTGVEQSTRHCGSNLGHAVYINIKLNDVSLKVRVTEVSTKMELSNLTIITHKSFGWVLPNLKLINCGSRNCISLGVDITATYHVVFFSKAYDEPVDSNKKHQFVDSDEREHSIDLDQRVWPDCTPLDMVLKIILPEAVKEKEIVDKEQQTILDMLRMISSWMTLAGFDIMEEEHTELLKVGYGLQS
ncbi:hypothetical protein QVD17_11835 [Tagetes erecta]|uniref:Uncharacterized protein n=1 Tax=Tagetes erecta TaxID=13708 RepID=A0AAD8KYT0_TARER|nr:hypothetical protein QVD17_11835 [Tagetes erecta]